MAKQEGPAAVADLAKKIDAAMLLLPAAAKARTQNEDEGRSKLSAA
jgi:hypothetical protein